MVEKKPRLGDLQRGPDSSRAYSTSGNAIFSAAPPSVFAGRRAPSREQELEVKIAALEAKLARKDAIIAEVSEEYVKLKKALGEP